MTEQVPSEAVRADVDAAVGFRYSLPSVLVRLGTRRVAFEAEAHRRFDAVVGPPIRTVRRVDVALLAQRAATRTSSHGD